jgi:large subunit ribosomal protein L35
MPKQKTRRGAAKRFRLTGTGKLKRNKANHRHMLIRRSKSVKRKMRNSGLVDKSDERKVRRMLSV